MKKKTLSIAALSIVLISAMFSAISRNYLAFAQPQIYVELAGGYQGSAREMGGGRIWTWVYDLTFLRDGEIVGGPYGTGFQSALGFKEGGVSNSLFAVNATPNRISFKICIWWLTPHGGRYYDEEQVDGPWPNTYSWTRDTVFVRLSGGPPFTGYLFLLSSEGVSCTMTWVWLANGIVIGSPYGLSQVGPDCSVRIDENLPVNPNGISFNLSIGWRSGYLQEIQIINAAWPDTWEFSGASKVSLGQQLPPEEEFGGIAVPVDKLDLLAPYIGLASTVIVATVTTAIYVKHVKQRNEKQYERQGQKREEKED